MIDFCDTYQPVYGPANENPTVLKNNTVWMELCGAQA